MLISLTACGSHLKVTLTFFFQENSSKEEAELGRSVSRRDRHVRPPGREARVGEPAILDPGLGFDRPFKLTGLRA